MGLSLPLGNEQPFLEAGRGLGLIPRPLLTLYPFPALLFLTTKSPTCKFKTQYELQGLCHIHPAPHVGIKILLDLSITVHSLPFKGSSVS